MLLVSVVVVVAVCLEFQFNLHLMFYFQASFAFILSLFDHFLGHALNPLKVLYLLQVVAPNHCDYFIMNVSFQFPLVLLSLLQILSFTIDSKKCLELLFSMESKLEHLQHY